MHIKNWSDVPGFINNVHANHIKSISLKLPNDAKVIEIGCMWGRSTWCWLDHLSPHSELTTIDNFMYEDCNNLPIEMLQSFLGSKEIFKYSLTHGCKKTWQTIVSQHPNSNISKLVVCDSLDFPHTDQHYDCVYIDGNHVYDNIAKDLAKFEPVCKIICGDDYRYEHLDVIQAVDEMIQSTGRKLYADIKDESGFWFAEKILV